MNDFRKIMFVSISLVLFLFSCGPAKVYGPPLQPGKQFFYSKTEFINYKAMDGQGPVLVFLHGFAASGTNWDDVKPYFEGKRACFFTDLKGFGFSSKPKDGDYSLETQAKIIVDFIHALNIEELILIGHSYGGAVAVYTQRELWENGCAGVIKKMVLIDSPCRGDEAPMFVNVLKSPVIGPLALGLCPAEFSTKTVLKQAFFNDDLITDTIFHRYYFFWGEANYSYALRKLAKQCFPEKPRDADNLFACLNMPTLIIWGGKDEIIDIEQGYELRDSLKNARMEIISDCGHVPQEEKPYETFVLINDFINERDP